MCGGDDGGGGISRTPLSLKFHFHGKFWMINFGNGIFPNIFLPVALYLVHVLQKKKKLTRQYYYLRVSLKLLDEW